MIAVDSLQAFLDETPTAIFIRQVLGVAAQLDKAMTVAKLRGARERKRRMVGKCEGRKSMAELRPEVVELARKLKRRRPNPSLRAISAELAAQAISPPRASRSRRPSSCACGSLKRLILVPRASQSAPSRRPARERR
jgi:hypothetical protein